MSRPGHSTSIRFHLLGASGASRGSKDPSPVGCRAPATGSAWSDRPPTAGWCRIGTRSADASACPRHELPPGGHARAGTVADRATWGLAVALGTFALGLVASGLVADQLRLNTRADAQRAFDTRLSVATATIGQEIERYFTKMRDIGAFYANANGEGPSAVEGHVRSARVYSELPALDGLIYRERVEDADVPAFLERMRATDPGFAILDPGEHVPGRPRFVLTSYVAGKTDYKIPLGSDARSIPSLGDVVQTATDENRSVAGSFRTNPDIAKLATAAGSGSDTMKILETQFFLVVPAPGSPGGSRPGPRPPPTRRSARSFRSSSAPSPPRSDRRPQAPASWPRHSK
jgi:hypothetical protein